MDARGGSNEKWIGGKELMDPTRGRKRLPFLSTDRCPPLFEHPPDHQSRHRTIDRDEGLDQSIDGRVLKDFPMTQGEPERMKSSCLEGLRSSCSTPKCTQQPPTDVGAVAPEQLTQETNTAKALPKWQCQSQGHADPS
mmetsp:Transcript_66088/g.147550  ORF Transcript_66088/g.147550 Transcript_66088/m.147550 type:complete len:138 (-) Transcript_66088:334-747(-)